MADRLRIDYDDLATLDSGLTRAITALEHDGESAETLAGAVGDARLADRIRGYSHGWAVHRGHIRENLVWLRDSVKQIHTEFEATDSDLAKGLKG
ncbi:hypothetical protein [Protaetiibacter intestinalis]|uniref:Flagellar protein FlgN n=1 Tax=Protaetiibacter intestinalis TaxID=2419774 RepID=A0A387BC92_9MICO|nr:hypothetical protein [Protaetiibacter intestinalis]AYF98519.1 hypothetical protein D7I47_09775 [Protaetiibacter intestinalis]